ncbi:MAG: hypothetical protein HN356_09800 [Calditrichaeota bacterium]|nr:hypothetical protein [Calditrichota bacterium]MBT7790505.1 hypothetical protein [Calditrichota bacterium]
MVRLKLEIITIVLFLSSILVSTGIAGSTGNQPDSAGVSNQLHGGAVSLRMLGRSTSASFGGKYHLSDHQAVQITIGLDGNAYWHSNRSSDHESNLYSFSISSGIGAQYLHYFNPESIFSPFVGFGPNTKITFNRSAWQENSDNTIYVSYNFGLDAIIGLEFEISDVVSLISEYIIGINYYRDKDNVNLSGNSEVREKLYQRCYYSYRLMSVGIAFYIR